MSSVEVHIIGRQVAALPWRRVEGQLEILLITTLTSKRWVVPKGWPVEGCSPSECAALEAFEEAGVVGATAKRALGSFNYRKRRKTGEVLPCRVAVFPLEVELQRHTWPEKSIREACWCSVDDALARVTESGLKRLITKFAKEQAQIAR